MILSDPSSERALLSNICRYGEEAWVDISDLLSESVFTIDSNKIIYSCLKRAIEVHNVKSIDLAVIFSAAKDLGLDNILSQKEESQHLRAIFDFPAKKENLLNFASKVKKLDIARKLYKELSEAQKKLLDVSGSESITKILSIAEDSILNFSQQISDTDNESSHVGDGLDEYFDSLMENPIEQVGISTGFPIYDAAIGGGLRSNTVNVIAARPKTGKTLLADNMGFYIANKLGIPVLNLDTEMTKKDHINRLIAMMTEIEIRKIETGKFKESPVLLQKVSKARAELKKTPLHYRPIPGKPFEEQLAIMKRWISKYVGLNTDGTAKPCVIFYDYLKLMDSQGISQDMKEYQVLGFMMTQLHNFAAKYQIPIVAFVQLNRDGITKESTDTASGSDRIIWLCSNFSIFKKKSDEEMAEDGVGSGNRKLIPLVSRHGAGMEDNDYINCHMKGWCAKISEGRTRIDVANGIGVGPNNNDTEFTLQNTESEKIDFI